MKHCFRADPGRSPCLRLFLSLLPAIAAAAALLLAEPAAAAQRLTLGSLPIG